MKITPTRTPTMTAIIRSRSIRLRNTVDGADIPMPQMGRRESTPQCVLYKPHPVPCPSSHHDARLNMPA